MRENNFEVRISIHVSAAAPGSVIILTLNMISYYPCMYVKCAKQSRQKVHYMCKS